MSKYESPFSIAHRQPVVIDRNDPRAKNPSTLERTKSRIGSKVILSSRVRSRIEIEEIVNDYFIAVLGRGQVVIASNIVSGTDNSVYLISRISDEGFVNFGSLLTKIDEAGEIEWNKKIDHPFYDEGISLDIDSNDNLYISGWTDDIDSGDPYAGVGLLIKYNKSGELQWSKYILNAFYDYYGWTKKIAIDSDNNIYYIANSSSDSPEGFFNRIIIVKVASNSNLIWKKTIYRNADHAILPRSITIKNNYLYICGQLLEYGSGKSYSSFFVIKLSLSGVIQFQKVFYSLNSQFSAPNPFSISVDVNNNIFIVGTFNSGDYSFIVKLNSSGNLIVCKNLTKSEDILDDIFYSCDIDNNNNLYVGGLLGYLVSSNSFYKGFLIKFSNDLDIIFQRTIASDNAPNEESIQNIYINKQSNDISICLISYNNTEIISGIGSIVMKLPQSGYSTGTFALGQENITYENTNFSFSNESLLLADIETFQIIESSASFNSVVFENINISNINNDILIL